MSAGRARELIQGLGGTGTFCRLAGLGQAILRYEGKTVLWSVLV